MRKKFLYSIISVILVGTLCFGQLPIDLVAKAETKVGDLSSVDNSFDIEESITEEVDANVPSKNALEDGVNEKTNGKVEDINTEPGTYFLNDSSNTFEIQTPDSAEYPSNNSVISLFNPDLITSVSGNEVDNNINFVTETNDSDTITGNCGETVEWSLNTTTGNLIVNGSGAIDDFSASPWIDYVSQIKSITIEDGITAIGSYAFYELTNVTDVVLTDTIEKIGFKAFANCTSLTTVNIPLNWKECPTSSTSGTINSEYCGHIFEGCEYLSVIEIPEGMSELPSYAFTYCDYLETVILPSTLTTIKNHTFYNCTKLATISVPEGVTYIGKSAFCYCSNLTNVTLPEGITELALFAFYNCTSLESIKLPNSIEKIGYQTFADCTSLTEINIPLNWKECPTSNTNGTINTDSCGHIFEGCEKLTAIEIPEGMTELPGFAFAHCDYLENIILPSTLTQINNHVFHTCSRLTTINVPEGVTYIGKTAFGYCEKLTDITLPEGITELALYAFYNCTSLEKIKLPDSIEKIGYQALANCTSLTDVNIPVNWKECPTSNTSGTINADYCGHVFQGCKKLTIIEIPEGMTELPSYAFTNCDYIETVTLPSTLTTIKNHTFYNCSKLTAIEIPEGVTYIGKSAFCYCSKLIDITLPEGITELALYAFYNCTSLESIILPDSIEKIGYQAFADCTSLCNINIPLNWNECVTSDTSGTINSRYCGHVFEGCKKLTSISLPDGMTFIPMYGFSYCDYLTTVYLPESLNEINKCAFYNCTSLTYVQLPTNLSLIGEYAFSNCTSLRAAIIPNSLTEINAYAYDGCSTLAAVSLPKTVTKLEANAFRDCSALSNIYYEGTSDEWNNISTDISDDITVSFGILCDYAEPNEIIESSYTKPADVDINTFYGGYLSSANHYAIDINEATFGPESKKLFVSLPKDSYITYGFSNAMLCPDDTVLLLTTTGIANERGDIYIQTLSGDLIFVGTTYETSLHHTITLKGIDEYVTGIKIVGRDLDGDSPGFDIVDIALMAKPTDKDARFLSKTTVTLKRDNQTYNLLKEEQDLKKDSMEEVSILVSADWKDYTPGTIALVQNNNIILENAGGSFVDIKPAELFSNSGSVFVVLLDANNEIVERRKILLTISGTASSRLDSATKTTRFTVYENQTKDGNKTAKYKLAAGATIVCGQNTYTTDTNGIAKVPTSTTDSLTVSKENYVSRTITAEQLQANNKIYLQPVSDNGPIISGVWIGATDVLNSPYDLSMLSTEEISLNAEIDWGNSTYGNIKLIQEDRSVKFTGDSLTTVISNKFDTSATIFIVATDADGRATKKELQFKNSSVNKMVDALNGASFEIVDAISITLPDNFKPSLFAGQTISADVSSIVPVTISAENGKIYVAIGAQLVEKSYEKNEYFKSGYTRTESETKTFIEKFKKTGILDDSNSKDSIKNLKNLKKTYKNCIAKPKGSFGVEADFTILGFAEGTYDNSGNIKWLDGGIILNPTVSVSYDYPFSIPVGPFVIPMYFETGLSADVKGQLNVIFNETAKNFTPNGKISGEVTLNGGVGVGIKKVLYASGGLEGKLKPEWQIKINETDYFKLSASLNAYAKAGIACFEGKYPFDPIYDEVWIEYPKSSKALQNVSGDIDFLNMYDTSTYKLKDLSYLEEESVFAANGTPATISLFTEASSEEDAYIALTDLKTNIYKESTPKIVILNDGTKLAVWIDSETSDINQVYLYYSYFDGTSWSNPQIISEDSTMDYNPCLKKVGDTVYVAWQNATTNFAESSDLTLDGISSYFDISVATFDVEAQTFSTITLAYDNLDLAPYICGDEENAYVLWVNNAENSWLGDNAKNSIVYSNFNGISWSAPVVAHDNLYSIDSITADYNEGLQIAYCLDTDGDITTSDDLRIYENGELASSDLVAGTSPTYYEHELYWYSLGNVISKDMDVEESVISSDRYEIVTIGEQKALIYTSANGLYSTLMLSYFNSDTNTWGEGFELTNGSNFIGSFATAVNGDNSLDVILNSAAVTGVYTDEDPYGASTLVLLTISGYCDLSLDNVFYSNDTFFAGKEMPFTIELSNKGTQVIDAVTVEIRDIQGNVLSSTNIDDIIVPGNTIEAYVNYTVEESITNQDIEIVATPTSYSDKDVSNNSQQITLSYEETLVENLNWGYKDDETVVISADIVNRGYNLQEKLEVSLVKDSVEGQVLEVKEIDKIEPLDLNTVSFNIAANENDVYYVVLKNQNEDSALYSDFISIYSSHTHTYQSVVTQATCGENGYTTYTCKGCDDSYKDNYTEALGHKYVTSITQATCTENGYTTYTCEKCGDRYDNNYIDAIGHKYVTSITKATTKKDGVIIEKCSECNQVASSKKIAYPKTISLSKTSLSYTGKAQKPTIKIKGSDGKTISAKNYTVTYSKGRKNIGKYTVKIKFKGNYSGTISKTFTIVPKSTKISSITPKSKGFTVKWKKQATQTNGYQIQYSTSNKFKSAKTITITKNSTVKNTVSKLKANKKYYVRIRTYKTVKGKKYYSSWSSVKSVKTKK